MDAVDQRKALASALSAHDLGAVRSCLHPSFVVRGTDGVVVIDYMGLLNELPKFFDHHPEYKQSVEVEASHVDGNTARLTTRHIDVLRTWRRPRDVPSRWNETWQTLGDKWVLVEERPHTA